MQPNDENPSKAIVNGAITSAFCDAVFVVKANSKKEMVPSGIAIISKKQAIMKSEAPFLFIGE